MIASLGIIFLWLSLILSFFQIFFSWKNSKNLNFKFTQLSINGLFFSSLASFLLLMYAYIISDFSLVNVYQNSHTTKPLIYKISATWGNHEGSMLLWILVLTTFNYFLSRIHNKNNSPLIYKALETQGLIILGFILFTILTSNPFEKMDSLVKNGLGFNPILQDPALAIHPPLLYIGYVGFSAVFSIGVAALRQNDYVEISWHNYMKPFVMIAWSFLTIGIAFGSIWAYYELGWGGWWFWDPVENASLMPWLLGTALLHSLISLEKTKSLESWVLLLSILTFLLSVLGTFLVRSGVLTSVHVFALDPSRGIYILTLTFLLGIYSLILFSIKSKKNLDNNYFYFFSKENSILINNILMIVVCGSVFLGTIYPLLIEALTNKKISVGEPYFNSTAVLIMIPAFIVMGIVPLLSWGKKNKFEIIKKIYPSILLTLMCTIIIFSLYKSYSFIGIVGISLSFWIIFNNVIILLKKIKAHSKSMIISHIGIGVLILGITGSSVWQEEKVVNMKIKEESKINNYYIIFDDISEIIGPNYLAIKGNFVVYNKEKKIVTKLKPEKRFYPISNSFTTEASIHSNLLRDLYMVLGDGNINDGWVVRIYYNPLVIWIWIGALTIFVGGVISATNYLKKAKYI
tara:strand:- start:10414 stop:12303 length:1890 start_codon:yes stop_codon:yes gene_type:complete